MRSIPFILLFSLLAVLVAHSQQVITLHVDRHPAFVLQAADTSSGSIKSANEPDYYIIAPSDSLQRASQEHYWFALTLRNMSSFTKWRIVSPAAATANLLLVDPHGQEVLWPMTAEPEKHGARNVDTSYFFTVDFSGTRSLTLHVWMDSTAVNFPAWHIVPDDHVSFTATAFALSASSLLFIVITLLVFSVLSADAAPAAGVLYFLSQGFWFFIQATERPIYTLEPVLMSSFQVASVATGFLLFPLLFNQSARQSITLKFWMIHALLVCWFFTASGFGYTYPNWLLVYTSQHLLITALLMVAGVVEQFLRGYRPRYYYVVCLLIGLVELTLYFIPWEYDPGLAFSFIPAYIVYVALVLRFIQHLRRRRKTMINAAVVHGKMIGHSVLQAQEEERARIARDLHDQVSSNLAALRHYAASIEADTTPQLAAIIKQLDQCAVAVRHISHNLLPPEFSSTSIDALLRDHIKLAGTSSNLQFDYLSSGDPTLMSPAIKLTVYRVALELITNVLKHARAKHATLQLICEPQQVQIVCEDDGVGITDGKGDGIGLKNIRSRVAYVNGTIHVDSNSFGTTVIITTPLSYNES